MRIDSYRVVIDNAVYATATLVKVNSARKHEILLEAVQVLTDLNLCIKKAYISSDGRWFMDGDGTLTIQWIDQLPISATMNIPKGLVEMVKRWHKSAVLGTRRIFFSRSLERLVADKGHFAVYAEDGSRFEVPLHFLGEPIFTELLKIGAMEFGVGCNGPIMLPCDGDLMESVLSRLRYGHTGQPSKRLDKTLCCSLWEM